MPSVVQYGPGGEVVVGRRAAALASEHPRDTIVSVKRFMGRGADDPETRRLGPYEFAAAAPGESNTVRFKVAGGRVLTPVEVSADILRALKAQAEDELRNVGGAVITVPAYFDDAQRQATKDAARLAGLEVLRLLNEPTAAALAYGLEKRQNGTFAVYDLGGGTFDVTILLLDDGVFQVRSTGGDSQLGGDDMDRAIAHELLAALGFDAARQTPELVRLVLDEARTAKHALTTAAEVQAVVPGHAAVTLARARFEALIRPLLERTGTACRRALKDAGVKAEDLDGDHPRRRRDARAGGASVRRGDLRRRSPSPTSTRTRSSRSARQCRPISWRGRGGATRCSCSTSSRCRSASRSAAAWSTRSCPRNSTIPSSARATYTTQEDHQTGFEIHVVQGEREMAADNRSLARFTLKGIPPMPAGMARLEVTFDVDADGLLGVHAKEQTTGLEQTVSVKPSYGLDDAAVEQMLIDALDHGEEDLEQRRLAENRVEARRILAATRAALETDADLLSRGSGLGSRALAPLSKRRRLARRRRASIRDSRPSTTSTKAFAGRRMNRAIARAIEGRRVDVVEKSVEHARGVRGGARPVMATVVFKGFGKVEVPLGTSLLEAATRAHFPEGSACGGVCACSTCHVHVMRGAQLLSEQEDEEADILDKAFDVRATSRLGCQSKIVREGEIEVEITRESLEAYENEHPDERGKYTK